MKKQTIPAMVILVLSLVVMIGSQTFLSPCVHEDGSFGSCHWAGQMMLGIGALIGLISLCACIIKSPGTRAGLYLAAAFTALLGILTPGTLISLCKMNSMRCRMVMQPAMILLCVLMLLFAGIGCLLERKRA